MENNALSLACYNVHMVDTAWALRVLHSLSACAEKLILLYVEVVTMRFERNTGRYVLDTFAVPSARTVRQRSR